MKQYLCILFPLLGAVTAWGQVNLGIRGGAPLRDAFSTAANRFQSRPANYTLGPTFEVMLPGSLSINFDALYQKLAYEENGVTQTGNHWNFPFMLRKRMGEGSSRPYLGIGINLHRLSGLAIRDPVEFFKTFGTGIVVGAGVDASLGLIHISPELRYTHHFGDRFTIGDLIRFRSNQFTALVGITF
jgi:hypothetical protein